MFFDVTQTETFVPLLYICGKFTYICILLIILLNGQDTLQNSNFIDTSKENRVLKMIILYSVICEGIYDNIVMTRSSIMQRISRSTSNASKIHIIRDVCVIVFTMSQSKKIYTENCGASYVQYYTASLLCVVGTFFLLVEVGLKNNTFREFHFIRNIMKIRYFSHVLLACILSFHITSECFGQSHSDWSIHHILARLVIYSIIATQRCYIEGIPGAVFLGDTPNILILSWIPIVSDFFFYASLTTILLFCIVLTTNTRVDSLNDTIPKVDTSPIQDVEMNFLLDDNLLQKMQASLGKNYTHKKNQPLF
jgi:hypothetical protein